MPNLAADPDPFTEVFVSALEGKKGLVVYVRGQPLSGHVTRIGADLIEMKSREYNRIVVRRDSIDAVAES